MEKIKVRCSNVEEIKQVHSEITHDKHLFVYVSDFYDVTNKQLYKFTWK